MLWTRAAAVAVLVLVVAAEHPAHAQSRSTSGETLNVPYLPQTEALCGGAATAMIFRFWGDTHASVQQFAPLVDIRAGGIADTALVRAIAERPQWTATRLEGSIDAIRAELAAGRPPMLLIEDRPRRYHYVVAVGVDAAGVRLHDPTWGPARQMAFAALEAAWRPTNHWMLRVTPTGTPPAAAVVPDPVRPSPDAHSAATGPGADTGSSDCDGRLNAALDTIAVQGLSEADRLLEPLIAACPDVPGPLRELAGVRFAQQRYVDASALAEAALARAPADSYAAEVLASSRFMIDDLDGALRAWNLVGRPILDSVRISGLTRTRYSLLAQGLGLEPDRMLTATAFRLARRRLESMPDLSAARLSLRPGDDGFAVADVAVVERPTFPRNVVQWAAAGIQAGLEREVAMSMPGRTGQGETWSASWGWWTNRPRVSVQFAAPRFAPPRGIWRVNLSWDAQTYGAAATGVREERLSGTLGMSQWLSSRVQVSAAAGLDAWSRIDGDTDRTLQISGSIERRLLNDRMIAALAAGRWAGLANAPSFGQASLDLSFRNRRTPGPLVIIAAGGLDLASLSAPLALWSGAGEGRSRAPLLRAHALTHDGRIDGSVFGRRLAHVTGEAQHWFERPSIVRLGAAGFVDVAAAGGRPSFARGADRQVDAGVGLRVRVPGRSGLFRVDYARGVRDGARAWVLGWQAVD